MSVNYEIKSQLAKLLATEDLLVEHKKVETASFNVDTRVLTLPMWDKASNGVYDLLVAHEVGHALFTPNIDWTEKVNIPPMFVNIVEDARIEKLMKRKYAGLPKTFYRGYKELNDEDFFSIEEHGVDKYGLADKVNLYFKIGNFVDISFDSIEESHIVSLISNAETFDEVLEASEILYKYCKNEKEEQSKVKNLDEHEKEQGSSSGETEDTEQDTEQVSDQTDFNQEESSNQESEEVDESDSYGGTDNDEEPQVETMNSLDQKLKDLSTLEGYDTQYLEVPEIDLDNFIISNSKIHEQIDEHFNAMEADFDYVDGKYREFKRSAQKEVNYLVKEFECKKSADAYARSFTSRTGVLDTSKLHTYKYNEDLFRKVNIVPDGKNHGLIFIIDWSGSMGHYMMDTIKQLFNLVWFCQKVKIPFDVYAFSNSYKCVEYDEDGNSVYPKAHHDREVGKFYIPDDVCLINLFTSGLNNKNFEKQMLNVWRNVYAMRFYAGFQPHHRLSLGGTPLNEALISLHQIIPQFKKDNGVQKVQCIVLTDGEGGHLRTFKKVKSYYDGSDDIRPWTISYNAYLRNRKTGYVYKVPEQFNAFTDMLLTDLRQSFKDTNFIGIRILSGSDFSRMNRIYNTNIEENGKIMNTWKKQKSAVFYNSGYHAYFMLSTNALQNDSQFEVSDNATKVQIKNAFQKSLKSKKMNKKILTEFVELVA
jgi:hypothetical protein